MTELNFSGKKVLIDEDFYCKDGDNFVPVTSLAIKEKLNKTVFVVYSYNPKTEGVCIVCACNSEIEAGKRFSALLADNKDNLLYYVRRAEIVDETGKDNTLMSFGEAIEALKNGKKVARKGWNGKKMFLTLQEGSEVDGSLMRNDNAKQFYGDGKVKICSHIDMKAADGSYVVGWLASQTDMLSNDWEIVD